MERQDRPSTADIASEKETRDESSEPGQDEEFRDRTRPRDDTDESAELEAEPLLADDARGGFLSRWEQIQGGFVDEPRRAVEEADALVAELMQQLAESFSQEREQLENQWDRGDDVSTEDLRLALQRYRSFFDRLLSA
jgi:hypothetical protein